MRLYLLAVLLLCNQDKTLWLIIIRNVAALSIFYMYNLFTLCTKNKKTDENKPGMVYDYFDECGVTPLRNGLLWETHAPTTRKQRKNWFLQNVYTQTKKQPIYTKVYIHLPLKAHKINQTFYFDIVLRRALNACQRNGCHSYMFYVYRTRDLLYTHHATSYNAY